MTSAHRNKLFLLLGAVVLSVAILAPTFWRDAMPKSWFSQPIKLGLDLRGGIYLVLGVETEEALKSRLTTMGNAIRADLKEQKVAIFRARAVSSRRLELTLLQDKARPQVEDLMRKDYPELAYVESNEVEGRTTLAYELKEEAAKTIAEGSVEQAVETIRNRVDQYGAAEPLIQRSGDTRIVVQLPDVKDVSAVKKTIGSVAKLEFRLVADANTAGSTATINRKSRKGGEVRLEDEVLMSGDAIERANVEISSQTNEAEVSLVLNSAGAKAFERATSENVGRLMAIVLDDISQSEPRINERISGGRAQITGAFTPEEAHLLAIVLRAGALPAPLKFLEERTIGASLGEDSIRMGVLASLIGTLVVFVFAAVYYRRAGLVANLSLILNVLFLLAMLVPLQATLTLPGIAGLALTLGMAIDSNVIIFERIREELRAGASNRASIEAGFFRAHWAIMDSNITTLLSGIVMYVFGSGPVRGFAVTLSIGILTTLFTALFVCKLLLEVLPMEDCDGKLSI